MFFLRIIVLKVDEDLMVSSMVGTELSVFWKWNLISLKWNKINADDVITFCLYLTSEMRRNLIKIRSCAIFKLV